MKFSRTLNSEEQQQLEQWLATKKIKLNNRMRREFSDVMNVARLLKQKKPRLVDMYYYRSQSSLALKLDNWEIFNLKVLSRLGYSLSRQDLEQLAAGSLTALKSLLFHLFCAEEHHPYGKQLPSRARASAGDIRSSIERLEGGSFQRLPTDKQQTAIAKVERKNIPFSQYKQLIRECNKKQKYISSVSSKVQYLESLILVKEERINKLTTRLATLSAQTAIQV